MNVRKKYEYKELIELCQEEGDEVLKKQFVTDLKTKNQQIVNTAEHKEIITKDGNKIAVYELSGQSFTMLVHAVVNNNLSRNNSYVDQIVNNPRKWDEISYGNNHISTSLISDKFMVTYSKAIPNKNDMVMYGFSKLPYECLKFTDPCDAGIDRNSSTSINYNMRNRVFSPIVNTITTVDDLMDKTIELNSRLPNHKRWNEVVFSRINQNTGKKIRPDFIVCMDKISENSIKAAQYFNVPIYKINREYYPELPLINTNNNIYINPNIDDKSSHLKR